MKISIFHNNNYYSKHDLSKKIKLINYMFMFKYLEINLKFSFKKIK
jgi:hypothetical protein